MTELETLVIEMASGLKLMTGMLALTVALLPDADRAIVLKALTALQTEGSPAADNDRSTLAARSSADAGKALMVMVENFAAEIAATRSGSHVG